MAPQVGDLLLVRDKDWVSREIESITHSPYSHVAVFVRPDMLIEAQGLRRVGYQDQERYRGIAELFICPAVVPQSREKIRLNLKMHIGQHYDYFLLVLEWIRYKLGVVIPWYEHHSVICSTLAADVYRDAGLEPCPGVSYPSPGDIADSKLFVKVGPW